MVVDEFVGIEGPIEITLDGPITLDLGAVSDEPVEPGWHAVKIASAEAKLTRQKELPQIFIVARLTDEAHPRFNSTVIWNCMLVGDGLQFTKRCFKALGLPELLKYPSAQDLADDLVGRDVEVRVKHRTYEGEVQANVSNWRPVTFGVGALELT